MSPFISPDLLERLGASLVHFLWQGGVVALVLAVIRRFMNKPKVQYAASLGALLVLSCCPVVTPVSSCRRSSRPPMHLCPAVFRK